jgi:DNA-binding MarR family transcriptional regulator
VTAGPGGGRTFLEELSEKLDALAATLSRYTGEEARRREEEDWRPITAAQLRALIAARHARSEALGPDLASPGWSLLLELFRAHLEKRQVRIARLASDAQVPLTTALRWIDQLARRELVSRTADPQHEGVALLSLTEAGHEAMEDYFVSVQLGWATDAPHWSG